MNSNYPYVDIMEDVHTLTRHAEASSTVERINETYSHFKKLSQAGIFTLGERITLAGVILGRWANIVSRDCSISLANMAKTHEQYLKIHKAFYKGRESGQFDWFDEVRFEQQTYRHRTMLFRKTALGRFINILSPSNYGQIVHAMTDEGTKSNGIVIR